jgi:glycosyltransferase involved in cell wall biosynthesis
MKTWPVRYYINPVVSVIIPVGPNHEEHVGAAIESVYNQTYWQWEVIVVDDTGSKKLKKEDYPFANLITLSGKMGAGAARNAGLAVAKGRFVVFLDADDFLHPEYLERTIRTYSREGKYVYTDWTSSNGETHRTREYNQRELVHDLSIHSIVALIPTVWARDVGGFDENLISWEDSDFFIKMAIKGYCGIRLPECLFTYRYHLGNRRETGVARESELKDIFYQRYHEYIDGVKTMCCGKKAPVQPLKQQADILTATNGAQLNDMIRIEYMGPGADASVRSPLTGQFYGRRKRGDVFYVWKADADALPSLFKPVTEVEFVEEQNEQTVNPPQPL